MHRRFINLISALSIAAYASSATAEDKSIEQPAELQVLKSSVGVWDASFEVWPQGPEKPSMKFSGTETNRAYGEYWIASDLDAEMGGQEVKVHSIVGYDLDRKQLVGTVIDDGPYAASLTGKYDSTSKTVRWVTKAKAPDGTSMVQNTSVTQVSANERLLVLSVPGDKPGTVKKFMEIKFVRRK